VFSGISKKTSVIQTSSSNIYGNMQLRLLMASSAKNKHLLSATVFSFPSANTSY